MIGIRIYNIYKIIVKYGIFGDKMLFVLLEVFFGVLLLRAFLYEIYPFRNKKVKRGKESQQKFIIVYMILVPIVIWMISSSINVDIPKGYKIIIVIVNLIFLFWLTNCSSWFRNKISGFFNKLQSKIEKH